MANEPDPIIMKGLRLLQSKSPDSSYQLYQLFREVLDQYKGVKEGDSGSGKAKPFSSKSEEKKKEAEKRPHDKKADGGDLGPEPKKPKLADSTAELEERERRKEKERQDQAAARRQQEKELEDSEDEEGEGSERDQLEKQYEESTDEEMSTMGVDNFAMEMGLACVVCSQIVAEGVDFNLIECQECHKLYHKECHRPPITEEEVNDPRNVWYCSRCAKNLKKQAAKQSKPKPSSSSKESGSSSSSSSRSAKTDSSQAAPRKSSDRPSSSRESSSSSKAAMSNLATLASVAAKSEPRPVSSRSDQGRSGKTSSSTSSSSSSSAKASSSSSSSSKSSSLKSEQSGRSKGGKPEAEARGRPGDRAPPTFSRSNSVSKQSVGDAVREANKRMKQMKKKAQVQNQHKKEHYK